MSMIRNSHVEEETVSKKMKQSSYGEPSDLVQA